MELTIKQALQKGVDAHKEGKLKDAENFYQSILKSQPQHPDANHNLGVLAVSVKKINVALPLFKTACDANPKIEQYWLSYIDALIKDKQYDEAKQIIEKVKKQEVVGEKLKVLQAKLNSNIGVTFLELGKLKEAEASLKQAIKLKPDIEKYYNNLGITLGQLGKLGEAVASYKQAIKLKPDYVMAHNNLGTIFQELGKFEEAVASYKQAIKLEPDFAKAHNNLGNILVELGKFEEAVASYKQAIKLEPDFLDAHSNLIFLYGGFNYETSLYLKTAKDYSQKITKFVTSKFSNWSCENEPETLRIGFVSGDLRNHPVGYFLEGLVNQLGKSKLELYAYPTHLKDDDLSLRIKPYFFAWKPLVGISNKDAADIIHGDGIHILIDLSGHTAKNRLPIFAWKPAPIQISWPGYFASTGVTEIDYILGDPFVTPLEEANQFTEKIWQLPESYFCFTEPPVKVDIKPLPALINGSVTFGCFNKIERMNDRILSVWSRILSAVPNSKLFLKDRKFISSSIKENVFRRFCDVGIEKERLIIESVSPRAEYLAAYNRVDIALSPFPYGGVTTSAEGLWMGVPVITKKGNHFLSHLGESIAHNTGLSDWIASDEDEYVDKAIKFSSNLDDLAKLRSKLRLQVLSSPLFDSSRFANHFEAALRGMWKVKTDNILLKNK